MKEVALHTNRQHVGGLVGCISHLTLSTDFHLGLVEDAVDGKNINTCSNWPTVNHRQWPFFWRGHFSQSDKHDETLQQLGNSFRQDWSLVMYTVPGMNEMVRVKSEIWASKIAYTILWLEIVNFSIQLLPGILNAITIWRHLTTLWNSNGKHNNNPEKQHHNKTKENQKILQQTIDCSVSWMSENELLEIQPLRTFCGTISSDWFEKEDKETVLSRNSWK